jgi:hypothetical protein
MTKHGAKLPQFVCDLLSSPPERGEGLNLWFYRVARVLHSFRDEGEIVSLLEAATAGEPIRRGEIERAIVRSKSCAWVPGQASQHVAPAWPKVNIQKRDAVIAADRKKVCDAHNGLIPADRTNIHSGLVRLWEMSPVRIEDDQPHTEEIIDALFHDDDLLCAGRSQSKFWTRTRREWRGKLSSLALIVPSAMTARHGVTQEHKVSAHTLATTGPRRSLVVEQDGGSIDDQVAVLLHLREYAPLALALHSGGKSVHGWFACRDESEQTLREFMYYAVQLGADHATWCRSQFVRMPDGRRETGEQQRVFYFDPEQLA